MKIPVNFGPRSNKKNLQMALRAAKARSGDKYGIGGLAKTRHKPRPITLAKSAKDKDD